MAEYKALASSGAKWMNLLDAGLTKQPAGYMAATIAAMAPTVEALPQELLNKTYRAFILCVAWN